MPLMLYTFVGVSIESTSPTAKDVEVKLEEKAPPVVNVIVPIGVTPSFLRRVKETEADGGVITPPC